MAAALKGDDALLRALLAIFEKEGMRVIGSADAARDLLAPFGPLGRLKPSPDEDRDIHHAVRVVAALGALDIGQAAVVCQGLVLAVEAAEGTDAMLARVATLPTAVRGTAADRKGVLAKAAKPHQERRGGLPRGDVRPGGFVGGGGLSRLAPGGGAVPIIRRPPLPGNAHPP